jgi:NADH-quinone oxidoreductase subunit N
MLAFMAIITVSNVTNTDNISDFAGMSKRAPITSMILAATLFSLAGLPVFAGFTSKFYLFTAVAAQDLLWLSGLAIATSVISLYYYLMIVRQMYMEPPKDPSKIPTPKLALATMIILFSGMILLGIYPAPLMDIIQGASESLLDSVTVK